MKMRSGKIRLTFIESKYCQRHKIFWMVDGSSYIPFELKNIPQKYAFKARDSSGKGMERIYGRVLGSSSNGDKNLPIKKINNPTKIHLIALGSNFPLF